MEVQALDQDPEVVGGKKIDEEQHCHFATHLITKHEPYRQADNDNLLNNMCTRWNLLGLTTTAVSNSTSFSLMANPISTLSPLVICISNEGGCVPILHKAKGKGYAALKSKTYLHF